MLQRNSSRLVPIWFLFSGIFFILYDMPAVLADSDQCSTGKIYARAY